MLKIAQLEIDRVDDALRIDSAIRYGGHRDDYIRHLTRHGGVFVAYQDTEPAGFACLDNEIFLQNPYVPILRVLPQYRRESFGPGVGAALLAHLEAHVASGRIFVGPRVNNTRYVALLVRSGYEFSGSIEGLRGDQTVLIFSKKVGG